MPFEQCGAVWKIAVPEAPGRHTVAYVYDHEHGGSAKRSLRAARAIRDELASTMPFPITAMLTQYRDGTYATEMRFEPNRKSGASWTATYLRLDETTLRPKAAVLSRNISVYGYEGARAELERAWRKVVLQIAKQVDALVRKGVPVHHHGPAIGTHEGQGSRQPKREALATSTRAARRRAAVGADSAAEGQQPR